MKTKNEKENKTTVIGVYSLRDTVAKTPAVPVLSHNDDTLMRSIVAQQQQPISDLEVFEHGYFADGEFIRFDEPNKVDLQRVFDQYIARTQPRTKE